MDVTNHLSSHTPIPLLASLKGEKDHDFPPLQGEGQGGGGLSEFFSRRLSRWGKTQVVTLLSYPILSFRQNEFDTSSSCIEAPSH